jgi:alkylation response protein AidB-like acyl-CoA dehydrogenase
MAHRRTYRRRLVSRRGDLARAALDSDLAAGQIFFVSGKNPLLTRESTDPMPVMPIFGGTTEIQKEIIARSLGL